MKRRRNGRNLRHVANLKKGQREVEGAPLTPRLVLRVPSVPSAYSLRLSRVSGVGCRDTQLRHLHSLFIRIHLAFICALQMVNGKRLTVIAAMDRLIHMYV